MSTQTHKYMPMIRLAFSGEPRHIRSLGAHIEREPALLPTHESDRNLIHRICGRLAQVHTPHGVHSRVTGCPPCPKTACPVFVASRIRGSSGVYPGSGTFLRHRRVMHRLRTRSVLENHNCWGTRTLPGVAMNPARSARHPCSPRSAVKGRQAVQTSTCTWRPGSSVSSP